MKKILPLSLMAFATIAFADISQQEFLYKDPRIMGMGAANTAVGGYSTAVFHNPAGLINIKKSHGLEVELLGFSLSASERIQDFADDLSNANGNDEVSDVLKKYSGEPFQAGFSNYTSVSYHTESDLALTIGLLASFDSNFLAHSNGGSNGLLEVHSRGYGGVVVGAAKNVEQWLPEWIPGKMTVGVDAKFIAQKSYDTALDVAEIDQNNDDLGTYIQDTYEQTNSGLGIDLGVLYAPMPENFWNPTVGVSVMNIGTLNFENAYGAQPMTVNFGVAVSPKTKYADFKVAVDYVDALGAQQALVLDPTTNTYKTQDISYEMLRHLRVGASAEIIDNSWFLVTLNGGLYQGAYTAGLDLQLAVLKFQVATYQEQLGAKMGQLEDRRYVVGLGIGW